MATPKYMIDEIIDWDELSRNPSAIHLLEQNPEKIKWWPLSANPNAIVRQSKGHSLVGTKPERIYWSWLSKNPEAIKLITYYI